MKMTNEKVAKKLVPKVVKHLLPETVSKERINGLIEVLSENVLKYGYQSKKMIMEANLVAFSEFTDIAEIFFRTLNETVQMSMQLENRHYDKIIDCIITNGDAPLERKVELFLKIKENKRKERKEAFNACLEFLALIAVAHTANTAIKENGETNRSPVVNKTRQREIKEREKTERVRIKHTK